MKPSSSFTLIELLVVIAIMATLSTLLFPNFMGSRQRARDTQRKSDMRQIQKALEVFRQDQPYPLYPASLPQEDVCWSSASDCGGNIYMKKFPQDPLGKTGAVKKYYFKPDNTNLTYALSSCLENKADPDSASCPSDFNTIAGYSCDSNRCYTVNEP